MMNEMNTAMNVISTMNYSNTYCASTAYATETADNGTGDERMRT